MVDLTKEISNEDLIAELKRRSSESDNLKQKALEVLIGDGTRPDVKQALEGGEKINPEKDVEKSESTPEQQAKPPSDIESHLDQMEDTESAPDIINIEYDPNLEELDKKLSRLPGEELQQAIQEINTQDDVLHCLSKVAPFFLLEKFKDRVDEVWDLIQEKFSEYEKGRVLHAQGKLDEAKPLYEAVLEDENTTPIFNVLTTHNLGYIAEQEGDIKRAKELYEKAAEMGYMLAYTALARIAIEHEDENYQKAEELCDKSGIDYKTFYAKLGWIAFKAHDIKSASRLMVKSGISSSKVPDELRAFYIKKTVIKTIMTHKGKGGKTVRGNRNQEVKALVESVSHKLAEHHNETHNKVIELDPVENFISLHIMEALKQYDNIDLFSILKARFAEKPEHYKQQEGIDFTEVKKALEASPDLMYSLAQMENTGGAPDIIAIESDAFIFGDCSAESPDRRDLNYDQVTEMAKEFGVDMMSEEAYRAMQESGKFDINTWSWLKTSADTRESGRALCGDRVDDVVHVDRADARSHDADEGWRGVLRVPKA